MDAHDVVAALAQAVAAGAGRPPVTEPGSFELVGVDGSVVLVGYDVTPEPRLPLLVGERARRAAAGVPWLWQVDGSRRVVTVLGLRGHGYVAEQVVAFGEHLHVLDPLPLGVDIPT